MIRERARAPARRGQRHHARVVAREQLRERLELLRTPDQRRCRDRQGDAALGIERDRRRDRELGRLQQHGALERLQLGARIEAEPLDENAAAVLVGLERVRLAIGAVEGEHQ